MPNVTDEFNNKIMKDVVGVLCQNMGFHAVHNSSVDILADIMKRQVLQLAKSSHQYAEHFGRTQVNMDDAALALSDVNMSVPELVEYVQSFDPVLLPYAKKVPDFPLRRESKLNFLRPGSEEVLTREVHVHEYMPPMILEAPKPKDKDKDGEQIKAIEEKMEVEIDVPSESKTDEPKVVNGEIPSEEIKVPKAEVREKSPEKVIEKELVNGAINGITPEVVAVKPPSGEEIDESSEDEIEALENKKSPGSAGFSSFSGLAPKSKSRDVVSENPALKRVRMMLEEEGHPLRDIKSVMMTTSGYLTSSREGRLPEVRRPANIEFFEPLPPPPPEKKRKVLTMKRIVEGVKKIDKDENDSDKEREEPALFGNPDKIFSSTSAPAPPALPSESIEVDEKSEKRSASGERDKDQKKVKKLKKLKLDKETIKKLSQGFEKDKKKLKIFKKSHNKNLVEKSIKKSKKIKLKDMMMKSPKKLPPVKEEGLDNIDSDEDFGASSERHQPPPPPAALPPPPPLTMKPKKKDKFHKLPDQQILKIKKYKDKSLSVSPALVPAPKISPQEKKVSPVGPPKLIQGISPEGMPKKKRGRPRKNPLAGVPLPPAALAGLGRGLMEERPLKIKKSHMEPDMRSLIPDISIKTKTPRASLNFDLLRNLPQAPGLIPPEFLAPPVKLPPHIPPSISITPATPSTPTPMGKDSKSPFAGLHSNVCTSLTITPINMVSNPKLPTPYDKTVTPGIGSPVMVPSNRSSKVSSKEKSAAPPINSTPSPTVPHPTIKSDSSSGITITPIMMDKGGDRYDAIGVPDQRVETKPQSPPVPTATAIKGEKPQSMIAKLEEDMKSKEQRKKDKERRKELKKEKKKEKKEKMKEKDRDKDKDKDKDKEKSEKKEKRDKSEKKKKKEKQLAAELVPTPATPTVIPAVPKLTLKISSGTPTPVDSPNPPQITIGGSGSDHLPSPPPLKKITIKPIEEQRKRTPSPELARFSPLVTRPPKPARAAKAHAAAAVAADAMGASISQQIVSFPPAVPAGSGAGSSKKGRGRPAKSEKIPSEKPEKHSKSKPAQQVGLVTQTVGCIVDEQGNKIWICPQCGRQDDGSPMIGCDNCDDWYHFLCVGILDTPGEDTQWFCPRCKKKSKKHKK